MRNTKKKLTVKKPRTSSPAKKKRMLKPRIPKTRNNGTMTESAFFNWIRQILRRSSMYWKPIAQVKKEAQVPYIGSQKRRKYSYVCSDCKKEFAGKDINVHHTIECGTLTCFDDLPGFVERLFVERDGLVVLCTKCHDKRHNL